MKTAIAELERELKSINDDLKEADESYAAAYRETREANMRAVQAYGARAAIARKRDRVAKEIKLLKAIELLKEGGEAS